MLVMLYVQLSSNSVYAYVKDYTQCYVSDACVVDIAPHKIFKDKGIHTSFVLLQDSFIKTLDQNNVNISIIGYVKIFFVRHILVLLKKVMMSVHLLTFLPR